MPHGTPLNKLPWTYRIDASEVPEGEIAVYTKVNPEGEAPGSKSISMNIEKQESGDLILSFANAPDDLLIGKKDEKTSFDLFTFEFWSTTGRGLLKEIKSRPITLHDPEQEILTQIGETERYTSNIEAEQRITRLDPSDPSCDNVNSTVGDPEAWNNFLVAPINLKMEYADGGFVAIENYLGKLAAVATLIPQLSEKSGPRVILRQGQPETINFVKDSLIERSESLPDLDAVKEARKLLFDLQSAPKSDMVTSDDSFINSIRVATNDERASYPGTVIAPVGRVHLNKQIAQMAWNTRCGGYENTNSFEIKEEFVLLTTALFRPNETDPPNPTITQNNHEIACAVLPELDWQDVTFESSLPSSK